MVSKDYFLEMYNYYVQFFDFCLPYPLHSLSVVLPNSDPLFVSSYVASSGYTFIIAQVKRGSRILTVQLLECTAFSFLVFISW